MHSSPHDGRPKAGSRADAAGFPALYKGSLLLPRPANSGPPFDGGFAPPPPYPPPPSTSANGRSTTEARALQIHSEAERRRRERINAHLSTLRRMIPGATKMDKASLLGRVIEQVKDLKREASEIGKGFAIPPEVNEVTVECIRGDDHSAGKESLYIKASICCDDRPDLFADLILAFHGLGLRRIKSVDITSLGGRVQSVFIICGKDSSESMFSSSLKESIREALARVASQDVVSTNAFSSKRQRLLDSHYSSMTL